MSQTAVARPYAKAAFEYAEKHKKLNEWAKALEALAQVLADPKVCKLLKNPNVDKEAVNEALFEELLRTFSDEELKNFVHLIASNHRLLLLPEIFQQFEKFRIAYEKMAHVQIISAAMIAHEQQEKLIKALKIRLQREVEPQFLQDPGLLGGVVIRIGDKVIDGSVKNKLSRMLNGLLQP